MVDEWRQLDARREILSAYVIALERSEELLRVTARVSGDTASATDAVAEAFGVSDHAARAILDLQVRRFTPSAIAQIKQELAELDGQRDRLRAESPRER